MSAHSALLIVVLLAGLTAGLTGCTEAKGSPGLSNPVVRLDSADERKDSVHALQAAWRERPRESTDANRRAELRFLKSLGTFLNRVKGTNEFSNACGVWNECVRDHSQQYGEIER